MSVKVNLIYKIKRATTTVALFEERNMKRKIFANINAFALMILL